MKAFALILVVAALVLCYKLHKDWRRSVRVSSIAARLRDGATMPVMCEHDEVGWMCVNVTRQSVHDVNEFYCVPANRLFREEYGGRFIHVDDLVDKV